jgi:hypothetical protein
VVEPDGRGARGYSWTLGEPLTVTDTVAVETRDAVHAGEPSVPRALRYVVGDRFEVEAETAAFAVVPLPTGYVLETLIRVMADDAVGAGFAEWVRARP